MEKNLIVPFITGDGIGSDIMPLTLNIIDSAIKIAYQGERQINWLEIYAGQLAVQRFGADNYLPEETLNTIRQHKIALKGPLETPIGSGMRSLNVQIRQTLDLYACIRPVQYIEGCPSPLKQPYLTDMVIFRENSEDIYAGIEWQAASTDADRLIQDLQDNYGVTSIRFPKECGIGIKPISREGSQRLIRSAIEYAITHQRKSVTLVHKGNIMKYTEGAFNHWGYELAEKEYGAQRDAGGWATIKNPNTGADIILKDVIADSFFQQILLRPAEYDVIATMNLNGDYISDALAAQVGGIGIAPGANIGSDCAVFEATHGSAPKYTGMDKVNPSSLILSGAMLLDHIGWSEASSIIRTALAKVIQKKILTYDLARQVEAATEVKCSEFSQNIVDEMN